MGGGGGRVFPTYIHTYKQTFLFGLLYNKKYINYFHGLYGEGPPERGTSFRLQVYERVEISLVEGYKRVGKSVIWV